MTAPAKFSIPTIYAGTQFRSKLEADYARIFDTLGVEWRYELAGHYFGNTFYLPDFWLPKSRQYVEVKGVFEPADCKKIHALIHHVPPRPFTDDTTPDIPIVSCEPKGVFRGWQRQKGQEHDWFEFLTKDSRVVELFQCGVCAGWWFADPEQTWSCQCCGAYAGDGHIAARIESPVPAFPDVESLAFYAVHGF